MQVNTPYRLREKGTTMKTKTIAASLVSGMLALSLGICGCASATQVTTADDTQATEQTTGGWETAAARSYLTDEEKAIYDKAMTAAGESDLKPVAVIATQLVSGTNYAYLCQSTSPAQGSRWCVAVVYADLQGNASLSGVNELDTTDLQTSNDDGTSDMMGSWQVTMPSEGVGLPQKAATAYADAIADYEGVELAPICLLGTQVVAGTNYQYLCVGTTMADNPVRGLYVVTVYEDLDGTAEVSNVAQLDLTAYVTVQGDAA